MNVKHSFKLRKIMNMKKLLLSASLITLIAVSFSLFTHKKDTALQYVPENTELINEAINGFNGAAQYNYQRRANLETESIDIKDVEKAKADILSLRQSKSSMGLNWSFTGPTNIGGRCRAILIDNDNPDVLYAGGVSGGLWRSNSNGSSWEQILYEGDAETNGIPNLNISSICQTANGDIYFGTGELFANAGGYRNTGFLGAGIWKSTDGDNFNRISSTWSDADSKLAFVFVNKLVAHPSDENKIFAATVNGLMVTSDGGETWENPILNVAGFPIKESCGDVEISSDGEYLIVDLGLQAYVSHQAGAINTWEKITGSPSLGLLTASSARTEFTIAPSDRNIMYAQTTKSSGELLNIYRSEDAGLTWFIIGPGGSDEFNPLGDQGKYDNIIMAYPDNADEIILGGQFSLWHWGVTDGWEQLTFWNVSETSRRYVHADQHEIRFHPENPNIIYVGSDGGISRSLNRGLTWVTLNKNFSVTQFYGIGHSGTNEVIGGTQDNGTLYVDPDVEVTSGTDFEAVEVTGGDGGYSEISQIDDNIMFSTIYYSTLYRSEDRGETMAPFYSGRVYNSMDPGNEERGHPFVTPIALWESFNDPYSVDTVLMVAPRDYEAGEIVYIESNIKEKNIRVVLEQDYFEGDFIYGIDHFQSQFAVGFRGGIYVTRDALSFKKEANWLPVAEVKDTTTGWETVSTIEWSNDGDILYYAVNYGASQGTGGSKLYRVSGFNENRLDTLMDITRNGYNLNQACIAIFNSRTITGIAVDPEVNGNVIVTVGNYGYDDYLFYSTSANSAPNIIAGTGTFVSKQGDLPAMPTYDAVIVWNDSRKVIVGTEYGLFATTDITSASPSWTDENDEIGYSPVYHLRQQTHVNGFIPEVVTDSKIENHGYIWAGTHGRGIFVCNDFAGPVGVEEVNVTETQTSLNLYPNPATNFINIDFDLDVSGKTSLTIYDVQGRLISTANYMLTEGSQHKQINISSLKNGMYILHIKSVNGEKTQQFIVR